MKRIILIALLFALSNNGLAAKADTLDQKAEHIASKTDNLKPSVVKLAMEAFYNSKKLGVATTKSIITVIDYSLPSTEKRLWVVDIDQQKILHTSLCAHGKYSGDNYTTNFSNSFGSKQTSIGLFLTESTYLGKNGLSLKIQGLEKGFNENAEARTIVIHGAPYVNQQFASTVGRVGRSFGCPAIESELAAPIINTIKNGTLVFSFYPDQNWLNSSRFINQQA